MCRKLLYIYTFIYIILYHVTHFVAARYLFTVFLHYIIIIKLHCQSLTTSLIFDNAYKKPMVASVYIKTK